MRLYSRGTVDDLAAYKLRQKLDRDVAPSTDIDDFPFAHTPTLRSEHICTHDIAHMRVVTCYGAVAKYSKRTIFLASEKKCSDRERIGASGVEARSIHIEIAEPHGFEIKRS